MYYCAALWGAQKGCWERVAPELGLRNDDSEKGEGEHFMPKESSWSCLRDENEHSTWRRLEASCEEPFVIFS